MRYTIALVTLMFFSPAMAAKKIILCSNGMHSYQVVFDDQLRTFVLNSETRYTVLAVENRNDATIVVGTTINDGPAFRAFFSQKPKVEYFVNSKLDQTDQCRLP